MTHVQAVADSERLPWLNDTVPQRRGGPRALLAWGVAATVLVAGASFWLGTNSGQLPGLRDTRGSSVPEATVTLPEAALQESTVRDAEGLPQVEPTPEPAPVALPRMDDVRPAREPAPRRIVRSRPQIRTATVDDTELTSVVSEQEAEAADPQAAPPQEQPQSQAVAPAQAQPQVAKPSGPPRPWTAWESDGASGRMVRIGTFRNTMQAKRAWSRLVKLYPGMKRLKAVVTDIPSLRNGRTYYRLQFGTTSQAHSEVLCQRMRTIGQSCIVVDLAGARSRNLYVGQPAGLR